MQILTKTDLDNWECPDCDVTDHPQVLQQECCGGAAVRVKYVKRTSRLVLTCDKCCEEVLHIAIG